MSVLVLPALRLSASSILAGLAGLLVLVNGLCLILENPYQHSTIVRMVEEGRQNFGHFVSRLDEPEYTSSVEYLCNRGYSPTQKILGFDEVYSSPALPLADHESTLLVKFRGKDKLELIVYPVKEVDCSQITSAKIKNQRFELHYVFWCEHSQISDLQFQKCLSKLHELWP